jgi:Co/Zn/Cd efflux system component
MTGIEIVAVVSLVSNVICLGLLHSLTKDSVAQKLLIAQMHSGMGNVAGRVVEQSAYLQKVGNTLTEFTTVLDNLVEKFTSDPQPFPQMGMIYRTLDGKYSARNLEELINEIKRDGAEENYLSEEEINNLRKMFETDDEDDEDDESDTDSNFNPKNG